MRLHVINKGRTIRYPRSGGGEGGEKYEVKFVAAKVRKKIVDGIHEKHVYQNILANGNVQNSRGIQQYYI